MFLGISLRLLLCVFQALFCMFLLSPAPPLLSPRLGNDRELEYTLCCQHFEPSQGARYHVSAQGLLLQPSGEGTPASDRQTDGLQVEPHG